jgi:glucosamine--fructose-6-phosphate aminotransferase (isomerizing)
MCGIFGFIGYESSFKYGIYGLRQLQNRGYDSAGGAGIDCVTKNIVLKKYASILSSSTSPAVSSIDLLEKHKDEFKNCTSGIYHTRWATHGAKTDKNAHPHMDYKNRIILVHNGIIENYYELKLELQTKYGIVFRSETDTEVIVNMISCYYDESIDSNGVGHIEEAIMRAVDRFEGTWALVVLSVDRPDNMYCCRHGSPLLVGFGDSHVIVTSEQAGFGQNVNNYICLNNGDLTVIRRGEDKVVFENLKNYKLLNPTVKIDELHPDPYPHWTIKEITEQYEASIRAISFGGRINSHGEVMLGGLMPHTDDLKQIEHLILLGCGTSLNAGTHAMTYFRELCTFTTVQAIDGSEFETQHIPKRGKTCCIFLSQSGETKDLYRCIKICRANNIFTIGCINVVDSLIAREVDCGCYLNAGREVGVASTKAFTSQVIVLSMIAIFFSQINQVNKKQRERYIEALRQLPRDIRHTVEQSNEECEKIANYLINHHSMFVLGKGSMLSVASEGSLKTKEIGYIHSEAYAGKALRHGPYALITPDTPIIFLIPDDENYNMMNDTVEEVKSREAKTIIITDSEKVSRHADYLVTVPHNSIYSGILHNIPMQLIAYHMSIMKGHNPDMPRNLSKCVSV